MFPLQNHNEMNETPANIVSKLRQHPNYPAQFEKAFGTQNLEISHILKALSQFMLICISANSKYDKIIGGNGQNFSSDEAVGRVLFEEKCIRCHSGPLFTDFSFRQNGLPIKNRADSGRYRHTANLEDLYKFRVPSLRNVEHSAPYMHDGRFLSLDAVLDFYRSGMTIQKNTDPELINENRVGISLTDLEKEKLIAFLKTLTDLDFLTKKELSR